MDKLDLKYVLTNDKLKKYISKASFKQYLLAKQNYNSISEILATKLATGIKKWALSMGATHFTHWFFPLNNSVAEKYVTFILSCSKRQNISAFSGKELLKTQADASSFMSTKQTSTHKACGYAMWDIFGQIFIKQQGENKILYIPSVFYSYSGDALDYKTPLIRSAKYLNNQATELLHLLGYTNVASVHSNLGCEQEYFLIDQTLAKTRTDLCCVGQTLFGAKLSVNLEAKNNYYQPFNSRLGKFMAELNTKLLQVGILAKIYHSEVSPHQFEIVPEFCDSNISADQNMLLLSILNEVAENYGYMAILNEKPFNGINGSGKHNNWSMATNSGQNLLDHTNVPPLVFLAFFTSVLAAVDEHNSLLMAAVTTVENSYRLGGHEAPPTIFSVYVGQTLQSALNAYLKTGEFKIHTTDVFKNGFAKFINLQQDICNRNRTSTFAFTGNKFEFRAVGSKQNVSLANTILNAIVAQQIQNLNKAFKKGGINALENAIKANIRKHSRIIYNGNCYSPQWTEIAQKRGIPNAKSSPQIYANFAQTNAKKLFKEGQVLSHSELNILQSALYQNYYSSAINLAKTFCSVARSQILPTLEDYLQNLLSKAEALKGGNLDNSRIMARAETINNAINTLEQNCSKIELLLEKISGQKTMEERCNMCYKDLLPLLQRARPGYDNLEPHLPQKYLPFCSYNALLLG